ADKYDARSRVEVIDGTHIADATSVTVKEAGELWLKSAEANNLEWSTIEQYRQHLNLHIIPFLGTRKLSKLTAPVVRAFTDQLQENGRSPTLTKYIKRSLGSLLADAQERGLAIRNPVHELRGRRKKKAASEARGSKLKVGIDIPTPDEIKAIIQAAKGRWRPFLLTAIFSGLRASELRGLRWSDVDLKKAELHVRQRADRRGIIGPPKSEAGERSVPLPPTIVNTLREWRLACPKGELDLVFPNGVGKVEFHVNVIQRGLWPTMIAAGVVTQTRTPKYTGLHSLRHFYASWCINRKANGGLELPPKEVQDRMGHSSIMVTMDVYGHLFPRGDDAAELAAAEAALFSTN
ncbi:MAG TPA: site-specific integrase, partial [Pseudolabrys sp.]|nr:site-specific integrase [Pseudolabrys sp.]